MCKKALNHVKQKLTLDMVSNKQYEVKWEILHITHHKKTLSTKNLEKMFNLKTLEIANTESSNWWNELVTKFPYNLSMFFL